MLENFTKANEFVVSKSSLIPSICKKKYETLCAICCHLYDLKNVKKNHEGVLLLVKMQAIKYIEYKTEVNCFLIQNTL